MLHRSALRPIAIAAAFASAFATLIVVAPASADAQAASTMLAVGSVAPDFTLSTVTAKGPTAKPFRLSEHKGETIVLAFFPKARTSGCTTQMETYRDKYTTLFHDGKKVTLIGVSTDTEADLTSWAQDAKFPFAFGADTDRTVGQLYGASNGSGYHRRYLYVIGPDGKITFATNFRVMAQDAYDELAKAVDAASR